MRERGQTPDDEHPVDPDRDVAPRRRLDVVPRVELTTREEIILSRLKRHDVGLGCRAFVGWICRDAPKFNRRNVALAIASLRRKGFITFVGMRRDLMGGPRLAPVHLIAGRTYDQDRVREGLRTEASP